MRPALLLILLLAAPALAGCTSDEPPADAPTEPTPPTAPTMEAPAPVTLTVATSGAYPVNPGFTPTTLSAPAGAEVTIEFTNAETAPFVSHDWVLEGVDGAAAPSANPGQTTTVTFTAPAAGEYTYFCSIGDHRARGMVGTFTVN